MVLLRTHFSLGVCGILMSIIHDLVATPDSHFRYLISTLQGLMKTSLYVLAINCNAVAVRHIHLARLMAVLAEPG